MRSLISAVAFLSVTCALAVTSKAYAWGDEGHKTADSVRQGEAEHPRRDSQADPGRRSVPIVLRRLHLA